MAKVKLLTNEWFGMVEKANTTVGELPLSPVMQKICFNILILQDETDNVSDKTDNSKHEKNAKAQNHADDVLNNSPKVNEVMHDVSKLKHSIRFADGKLHLGTDETAETTISLNNSTLQVLLSTMKVSDAMQAFINGDIQISGDISQMMALQNAKMSDEQNALYAVIFEHTEL